jgi:hypothetical protein
MGKATVLLNRSSAGRTWKRNFTRPVAGDARRGSKLDAWHARPPSPVYPDDRNSLVGLVLPSWANRRHCAAPFDHLGLLEELISSRRSIPSKRLCK